MADHVAECVEGIVVAHSDVSNCLSTHRLKLFSILSEGWADYY